MVVELERTWTPDLWGQSLLYLCQYDTEGISGTRGTVILRHDIIARNSSARSIATWLGSQRMAFECARIFVGAFAQTPVDRRWPVETSEPHQYPFWLFDTSNVWVEISLSVPYFDISTSMHTTPRWIPFLMYANQDNPEIE